MDKRFKSDAERILRYTVTDKGCWEWTGATKLGGYGHIAPYKGSTSAHRASYMFHKGEIPAGMLVLHDCDNRLCINPEHLRLGDHTDNQNDAYRRGRRPLFAGSKSTNAKITEQKALAIFSDSRTQQVVADEYGISTSLVSAIKNKVAWQHLWRTEQSTERAKMNLR